MIESQELESRISALEEEIRRLKQKEYDRLAAQLEQDQYELWMANMQMITKCYFPSHRNNEIEETQ